jgi:hypothetical protein
LPLTGYKHVTGEHGVGNPMCENAIGEVTRMDDPPVVSDSSYKTDFPIRAVFGGKE